MALSTRAARALACAAGTMFALASAATNVSYALGRAATLPEQTVWAAVALAASIGLAIAPSAILAALRARRYGAALLAVLALLVFGAYSITAALGAATGGRLVAGLNASDVAAKRAATAKLIEDAERELAAITTVRSAAEIEAEVRATLARIPGLDCVPPTSWTWSRAQRDVCLRVADLGMERTSAGRRAALLDDVREARALLASSEASGGRTVANADAMALQGFAAAVGVEVHVDTLNRLLVLLAVLVIELGGGLSFALAASIGSVSPVVARDRGAVETAVIKVAPEHPAETPANAVTSPVFTALPAPALSRTSAANTANTNNDGLETPIANTTNTIPLQPVPATTRQEAGERLIALLREHGGQTEASLRSLAFRLGAKPATLHAAVADLVDAGVLAVDTRRTGSVFRLVEVAKAG